MARIVIAGMGFGGLRAAKNLAGCGHEIVMVDRNNYHLFQPLLYQVATAALEQESIAYPVRALARGWTGAAFRLGEITGIDLSGRRLVLSDGHLDYDFLIVAAGSRTNFFGNKNIERHSFDLKRLDQAESLRNHILLMFEKASREPDPNIRRTMLTFVVVGGGPTGVEFAGAVRELSRHVLAHDYPELNPSASRIILVEGTSRILTAMPEKLSSYARNRLEKMGVEVRTGYQVANATGDQVIFTDGSSIATRTLFWSAGVAANDIAASLDVERGPSGRIRVLPDLSIAGHPEVYIIGDMAYLEQDGAPLPMMAPVANQQGIYAARAVLARIRGAAIEPFRYTDKGAMATIGRSSAVAVTGKWSFSGFSAWVIWLLLHLYYLIGFRNRILVMLNWAYYYFFKERQIRLITGHPVE